MTSKRAQRSCDQKYGHNVCKQGKDWDKRKETEKGKESECIDKEGMSPYSCQHVLNETKVMRYKLLAEGASINKDKTKCLNSTSKVKSQA